MTRTAATPSLRRAAVALAFVLCACEGGSVALVVDLKTDYLPGHQFVGVRIEVGDVSLDEIRVREDTFASTADDYLTGERVAELQDLTPGDAAVRVSLLDAEGGVIATRTTLVQVSGQHALTVLITSSCEGVSCPGPTDDPSFSACVGGRCVDPRCSPETPELCGEPGCTTDADCSSPVACADGVCIASECFLRADDSRCAATELCAPQTGCVQRPDVDAGMQCAALETSCDDGADEDCDGATDCADSDCLATPCDDGSACTEDDACMADGTCGGTAVLCDDANACTDDACDAATGCTFTNNTASCDDGSLCTEGDTCSEGACAGTPIVCNDGSGCTDDTCDPAAGCVFTNNTASCDDGFWCNGPDRCADGACVAEGPAPCTEFCNETTMACDQCVVDADCGAVAFGTWSTCAGFTGGTCDESGTQSRSVMTPRCMSGMCTVVTTSESRGCSRQRDGVTCGSTTYSSWSGCNWANGCDESATQSRTRTERRCNATGSCTSRNSTENRSCSRSRPNGTSCGSNRWMRCCSGACRDLRTNARCGACNVSCNAIGETCAGTGTGGYSCRGCTTNAECRSILNSAATCYNTSSPPAWCQCQCSGGSGVCANGGCGAGFWCHDCSGTNFCAPFGGSC